MKTNGFNTRKMERLIHNRNLILSKMQCIDNEIAVLTRTKNQYQHELIKMNANIEKVIPRLNCEKVKVFKTNVSIEKVEKLF